MNFKHLYSDYILEYPKRVLAAVFLVVLLIGSQATKVEIDASSETLLLQDDADLAFTRKVNERYHNPDYLVITYTPEADLLSDTVLEDIGRLSRELEALPSVESVTSIRNVPLLQDPSKSIKELLKDIPTLETPGVDKELARKEFLSSAIYSDNLVSPDFKTTALQVNFYDDTRYFELLYRRNALTEKSREGTLDSAEAAELVTTERAFKVYRDAMRDKNHETIQKIRDIMKGHRGQTELFLGGVNMIADDMVTFVKYDLKTYGATVLGLLVVIMWFVFRQLRFVLLPVLVLGLSVLTTTGLLGIFGWEVTVVSSNFISLQLIVTMSLIIHLSVRYRELLRLHPEAIHRDIVEQAALSMLKPCFFVIITTVAGFSSLVACDILPVINLGWMMSTGIAISLVTTFLVFPAVMVLLPKKEPNVAFESRFMLTKKLARFTEHSGKTIFLVSAASVLFSLSGAERLKVENSFIDYFKPSTEIYQGMEVIDRQLGGTTPLDIIIDFPPEADSQKDMAKEGEKDEFADFEEEFSEMESQEQYWFTSGKMAKLEKIHDYLDALPEVGKVLSFATTLKVGRVINKGEDLDNLELALLYNELPEKFKKILITPYLSLENNQARFTLRIVDSMDELRRDELLKRIKRELHEKVGIPKEDIRLANMMVMYNNMLQSLFNSQILTLGAVVLILAGMFYLLLGTLKLSVIALVGNIIPVGVVFGIMGWVGIPLDMMTITIAAISMGIAVDDTIHYLHRFPIELAKDGDYVAAMHRSHATIGYAMYYTTVAIIIGFSVLVLSNFYPTLYFGLLVVLAMFMAIVADLLLVPAMILKFKPFGDSKTAG